MAVLERGASTPESRQDRSRLNIPDRYVKNLLADLPIERRTLEETQSFSQAVCGAQDASSIRQAHSPKQLAKLREIDSDFQRERPSDAAA